MDMIRELARGNFVRLGMKCDGCGKDQWFAVLGRKRCACGRVAWIERYGTRKDGIRFRYGQGAEVPAGYEGWNHVTR